MYTERISEEGAELGERCDVGSLKLPLMAGFDKGHVGWSVKIGDDCCCTIFEEDVDKVDKGEPDSRGSTWCRQWSFRQ